MRLFFGQVPRYRLKVTALATECTEQLVLLVAGEAATKSSKLVRFAPGDYVEVTEGELTNLQGRVISLDGNKITMIPKHEDLQVCFLLKAI